SGAQTLDISTVKTGTLQVNTLTGTRTNGSPTITGLSSTALLAPGDSATGTGIPAGTTIVTINSGTSVTLSNNATSNGTSSIAFGSRVVTGLASTAGLFVGQSVTGTGIPAPIFATNSSQDDTGTKILSIDGPNQITLTQGATANGAQ